LVEKSELWVYKDKLSDIEEKLKSAGTGVGSQNPFSGSGTTTSSGNKTTTSSDDDNNNEARNMRKRQNNSSQNTGDGMSLLIDAQDDEEGRHHSLPFLHHHNQGDFSSLPVGTPNGFFIHQQTHHNYSHDDSQDHFFDMETRQQKNYQSMRDILTRLKNLCIKETQSGSSGEVFQKPKKHEQRLLRNMRAHSVVLELLQIPYDKKEDVNMKDIMRLAHEFLQAFCLGNHANQILLHKSQDLFMTSDILSAKTLRSIYQNNYALCSEINERVVQHFIHCIETVGKHVQYLKFLQTIVKAEGQYIRRCQDMVMQEMENAGEDVLLFYNDKAQFKIFIELMQSKKNREDESSPLQYHVHLVQLLAKITEGKNVFTEIRCHSYLNLDDIIRVVTHPDCISEVKDAYINFLNHCFIDTEVEMKEIYISSHIWKLFENFLIDISAVVSRDDHAEEDEESQEVKPTPVRDLVLENYVCVSIMNLITTFFNSPFSDQSTTVQVSDVSVVLQLSRGGGRVVNVNTCIV
jgi:inositol 1,4,5-triphosphate receptor type 1